MNESEFSREVQSGERFRFGQNWSQFLEVLNDDRIREAERSLRILLSMDLRGLRFLDIGCGSGLFSLAARRAGADVFSFDYDPQSVACAAELRRRYFPDDGAWVVQQGSVLDSEFMSSLGEFDIVYSWGVLHHTGAMWEAIANASERVRPGGAFAIAIYNDQGWRSDAWRAVKRVYNAAPKIGKNAILIAALGVLWGPIAVRDLLVGRPFSSWRNYHSSRGMSAWHDLVDWVGGYPFEVSTPKAIEQFVEARGFSVTRTFTCGGGLGCNQYAFART